MGLLVTQVAVGGFDENFSYVIADEETEHVFIVDPSGDIEEVLERIEDAGLTVVGVLLTHTHRDHLEKLDAVLALFAVPVYVHESGIDRVSADDIVELTDGNEVKLGGSEIRVLYTPGHIDDAVCYYIAADEAADGIPKLITGDTLFVEGCGRTDENGVEALYASLQRLKELPNETEVYPGHDYGSRPVSTIAYEKANNTYMLASGLERFRALRLG